MPPPPAAVGGVVGGAAEIISLYLKIGYGVIKITDIFSKHLLIYPGILRFVLIEKNKNTLANLSLTKIGTILTIVQVL